MLRTTFTRRTRSGSLRKMSSLFKREGRSTAIHYRRDHQHRRVLGFTGREPLVRMLPKHARRERAEALAELDLDVHRHLHSGRPGIAENTSGPKSPRAELHSALKPSDDLLVRQRFGGIRDKL